MQAKHQKKSAYIVSMITHPNRNVNQEGLVPTTHELIECLI